MSLNWGIVGLGKIANKFVKDLALVDGCKLAAVASSNKERANEFGDKYGADNCYSSYNELFKDEQVEIVYIATPHSMHMDMALDAMNSGKHVLCEKPLAVNKQQVQKLIDASRLNNVFLMEGLWSRFNPSIEAVLDHIHNHHIGKVNYINADFCFFSDTSPESRLVNMELAGGALLDIGVYPIFLSYLIMGYPEEILATSIKHTTGADIQTSAILKYKDGMSNVMSGLTSNSEMIAKIYGTDGMIMIDDRWHEAEGYKIECGGRKDIISLPTKGMGFTGEINECLKCVKAGKIESSKWSHQDSLNLISICDEIRRQIDLVYPFE